MRASIDRLTEKLLRQVKTKNDKRSRRSARGGGASGGVPWRRKKRARRS